MHSVILLTVDCLRADHVGCYGYHRPTTPHIDSFADQSTVFEYSYSNCPGTRWAFQSIHTGLHASRIHGLGIPLGYPHALARKFQENGYETAGFAHNGFISRDFGYDIGFDTFVGVKELSNNLHPLRRLGKSIDSYISNDFVRKWLFGAPNHFLNRLQTWNEGAYRPDVTDSDITEHALDWIMTQQSRGNPYFAWIHFMDAHTPYGRYDNHLKSIRGDTSINHSIHPGNEGRIKIGEQPEPAVVDTYDANIRSVDQQIGRILQVLDSSAIVLITGDHGEEFGQYNAFHTESFYSSMTQVPMIIHSEGFDSGVITQYPVQHLDIAPTLLYEANLPVPNQYEGDILQLTQRRLKDPIFFSLTDERVAVRVGDWKLIQDGDKDELYHTPHGENDGSPEENREKQQELEKLLSEFKNDTKQNKIGASEYDRKNREISATVKENLNELGYID